MIVLHKYLLKKKESPKFVEASDFDDFITERNNKGFGSSGV